MIALVSMDLHHLLEVIVCPDDYWSDQLPGTITYSGTVG